MEAVLGAKFLYSACCGAACELSGAKFDSWCDSTEKELSRLENDRDLGRIDDANYVAQKREIEQRYDFRRDNT
jgi:hypothetical protein